MLHILNGDSTARVFQESGLAGEVLVWREALVMGPCPADLSPDEWMQTRARHLSETYDASPEVCLGELKRQREALEAAHSQQEVVLWFEKDLFCLANLFCVLNGLGGQEADGLKISLAGIEPLPGSETSKGLGGLAGAQLAALFEQRHPVSETMLDTAREVWRAYGSADPTQLYGLVQEEACELAFAKAAFHAHLRRLPSVRNGLGRIQNLALDLIAGGIDEFGPLFHMIDEIEPAYGFGDWQIWKILVDLTVATNPLLTIHNAVRSGPELGAGERAAVFFKLTDTGRAILVGNSDMLNLNNVDYWLGGVHVVSDKTWRWDEKREKPVRR